MSTGILSSGEAQIAFDASGDGDPIVFLHAGVADRRMWREQVRAVADAGFRGVAYDRRGFGDTYHVDEAYSHVSDLAAVLDAVVPGLPAVLVGCSQGGRVAIDAALARPDRVRALFLVAPAISGAPEIEKLPPAMQAWIDRMEAAEASADVDRINALEAHAWLDGPLAAERRVGGAVRDLFLEMNELVLRAEQRGSEIPPPEAYSRVHEITCPALVMWGDLDFPHIGQRCEYLVAHMPRTAAHRLRGAAHLPNLEDPEGFNRTLLAFLASL
jgi:pimeloyl-ACP methyl ester carboxylesterase